MIIERFPDLRTLTAEEKLILVGELWDELASNPETFPARDDHVKLLRERLDHYKRNPADVVAWEELKSRILASR